MFDRHLARFLLAALLVAVSLPAQETVRTFAVRVGGRLAGSVVETETATTEQGRAVVEFTSKTVAKVELLGSPIDQHIDQTWILDPHTRGVLRLDSRMRVGNQEVKTSGRLVDGQFRLDGGEVLDPSRVVIAPDFRWLAQRGPKRPGERVELEALLPEIGGVHGVVVALEDAPDREIDVLGRPTKVRAYEFAIVGLGIEATVFLTADGEWVRYEMAANDTVLERVADDAVGTLDRVDLTDVILVRTNLDVPDSSALTWMKLRATIETSKSVTAESLNVGTQTFEGTVENGRVDGVFELRSKRVDGTGSPAFPPPADAFAAEWLQPYLQPSPGRIESDDPGIAQTARELAKGAATCFVVVERLARWCHDEIPYVIPGGGTAKGTFEQREGECGGHSRLLAAMLRAVGIPARTPMGGMYVPLHGGSFGQHMWTEVWLGEAIGWLPVDCTAGQLTYADASHIRLSDEEASFLPKSIEVLDHAPKQAVVETSPDVVRRSDAFPFLAGEAMVFRWLRNGQELGDERVTYTATPSGGHVFDGSIRLANGAFQETTRSEVGDDGRLVAFAAERTDGPQRTEIEITLADGKAVCVRRTAGEESSESTAIEPDAFVLHNNCMVHFLVPLCRYWPIPEGATVKLQAFHTEQRSQFAMTLRRAGNEAVTIGERQVQAHVVQAELAGLQITLHVDDRGRLLRFHQKQGGITVELQPR